MERFLSDGADDPWEKLQRRRLDKLNPARNSRWDSGTDF